MKQTIAVINPFTNGKTVDARAVFTCHKTNYRIVAIKYHKLNLTHPNMSFMFKYIKETFCKNKKCNLQNATTS